MLQLQPSRIKLFQYLSTPAVRRPLLRRQLHKTVKDLLGSPEAAEIEPVTVRGWVKHFRGQRFLTVNDGSCAANLQCVLDQSLFSREKLKRISHGASVEVSGKLVASMGCGQAVEVQVDTFEILGDCDAERYPIQPKRHSLEFLRENAHLRIRTQTFGAVMRMRSALTFSTHDFFRKKGFSLVHTPVVTKIDAEGAGEMFSLAQGSSGEHFFGSQAHLTVSGQLQAEALCLGLGKVFSFGPTFRAENSNTSRHLAEFWMVEPEMAFVDMNGAIDLAQGFLQEVVAGILEESKEDLAALQKYHNAEAKFKKGEGEGDGNGNVNLVEMLEAVARSEFVRVSYTDALQILRENAKIPAETPWGIPLQTEHERFLAEQYFQGPVVVFDYPREVKAFYMRVNDDQQTVAAFDVLLPGIGEIIGGSQREDRLEYLRRQMDYFNVSQEALQWYIDTRQFGSAVHSGFGLGFERLVQYVCGMNNIRDSIPFPRTPGSAPF